MNSVASKETFWEYHRLVGKPFPGVEYGVNCPPPPEGMINEATMVMLPLTKEQETIEELQAQVTELTRLLCSLTFVADERAMLTCYLIDNYDGYTKNDLGHGSVFGGSPVAECDMCKIRKIYNEHPNKDEFPPLQNPEIVHE